MRRLAVGCFLVLVVLTRPHAQPAGGPLDAAAVQELLTQFHVPGVSIAVIKDFKIEWAKGYGVADVETGAPVTTDTMFQAASISKTDRGDGVAEGGAGRPLHARSGHQHDPEVVEAAGEAGSRRTGRSRRGR